MFLPSALLIREEFLQGMIPHKESKLSSYLSAQLFFFFQSVTIIMRKADQKVGIIIAQILDNAAHSFKLGGIMCYWER